MKQRDQPNCNDFVIKKRNRKRLNRTETNWARSLYSIGDQVWLKIEPQYVSSQGSAKVFAGLTKYQNAILGFLLWPRYFKLFAFDVHPMKPSEQSLVWPTSALSKYAKIEHPLAGWPDNYKVHIERTVRRRYENLLSPPVLSLTAWCSNVCSFRNLNELSFLNIYGLSKHCGDLLNSLWPAEFNDRTK